MAAKLQRGLQCTSTFTDGIIRHLDTIRPPPDEKLVFFTLSNILPLALSSNFHFFIPRCSFFIYLPYPFTAVARGMYFK